MMAEAFAEGIQKAGGEATLHNTNHSRYNIEEYRQFDAVAIGSPDYFSYIAGTLKTFLDDWFWLNPESHRPHPQALRPVPQL